ncbi:MAG: helix-turn-helix domain-containing protein [Novosphingobium sp.]
MPIPAHFEDLPHNSKRPRAARRQLRFEAQGATAAGEAGRVLIHNVSATGLLIESAVALAQAERIEIALPLSGSTVAHVVWASESFYGCRFDLPVPESVLSALEVHSQLAPAPTPAEPGDTLPVRIARLRKEQGLTLEALAALLDVSKPTVWAWEQGKSRPAPERIPALAEGLGVAEEELLTGRDGDALAEAIGQARRMVAKAYGVDPACVKVSIEL